MLPTIFTKTSKTDAQRQPFLVLHFDVNLPFPKYLFSKEGSKLCEYRAIMFSFEQLAMPGECGEFRVERIRWKVHIFFLKEHHEHRNYRACRATRSFR